MIRSLTGSVAQVGTNWVVLDVSGVGFLLTCPPSVVADLHVGDQAHLSTVMIVREDDISLYGFASAAQLDMFTMVQRASGVGPKLALAITSMLSPSELAQAITTEDYATLTSIPGIGKKSAERLVIELRDKVANQEPSVDTPMAVTPGWRSQITEGLVGLGWSAKDADRACEAVEPLAQGATDVGLGELMKQALAFLGKK